MKKDLKDGISVIIPTFNRANYLYSTLICLCNQKICDGVEYEIVIVDSGEDETENVVQMFQKSAKARIVYKKIKKCRNRSLVRNTGAKLAKYNIFCFLDNDMLTPPDFIQRHYDEHRKQSHLVLMGCRRSLISFEIAQITEEALVNDFSVLGTLPYYNDERIEKSLDSNPWRFVFSHTLSIESRDFFSAGQFNVEFGEHWGFEDLELGFNLMNLGCNFQLIKDSFTYHQPHFSQSNKEQHEQSYNGHLILKLHNCFECELYTGFYTGFDKYYPVLTELKSKSYLPEKKDEKEYDLILGSLFSADERKIFSGSQLGIYCPADDDSFKKVLILNNFFLFPAVVQIAILAEAFRVGKEIYFKNLKQEESDKILKLGLKAGLLLAVSKTQDNIVCFEKKEDVNSDFFIMTLPVVFSPQRRFVYKWLAKFLMDNGKYVNIRDIKGIENTECEDYNLDDAEERKLSENINVCFGLIRTELINSLSNLLLENGIGTPNDERSIVFYDEDFFIKYNTLKLRGINKTRLFSELFFNEIEFLSVYDYCINCGCIEQKKNSFCCFMENGYKEDGIDLIVSAFAEYHKLCPSSLLFIKMPDFNVQCINAYPNHNRQSKLNKLFPARQKSLLEYLLLKKQISDLGISEYVEIVRQNKNIKETARFLSEFQTVIFANRNAFTPPEFYMAIMLKKNIIIPAHFLTFDALKPYYTVIKSELKPVSDDFDIPASCLNSAFLSGEADAEELEKALSENTEHISGEKLEELKAVCLNDVKQAFVEGKKRIQFHKTESV
ncbi:MAG: glycosyltransferase family 2 protein [Treponema sp.]|nr:glycosyltransferase family 2 protein [Treponema sp.]